MRVALTAALVAATVALAAGDTHMPCGAVWKCPEAKSEVCGVNGATEKTFNNACEAYCAGFKVKNQNPCVADLLKRFEFCKTMKDKQSQCQATEGCNFEVEQQFGSGDREDFETSIETTQGCNIEGATADGTADKTKCEGLKTKDDTQKCMYADWGEGFGECQAYEQCQASASSKELCESRKDANGAVACAFQSFGFCLFEGTSNAIPPQTKEQCELANGKWQEEKSCQQKYDDLTDGGEGGAEGDSRTSCMNAISAAACDAMKDDKGTLLCESKKLEANNGFCENKDPADTDSTCWDNEGEDACNLKVDKCQYTKADDAASFQCDKLDPCKAVTDKLSCTGTCKWYPVADTGEDNKDTNFVQQCFHDENGLTDDSEDNTGSDICSSIQNKVNCLAKKNTGGQLACTYAGTEGECGIEGGDQFSLCQCDENCADDYSTNGVSCNKMKDIGGKQCVWDPTRAFSACLQKTCYAISDKVECNSFEGCEFQDTQCVEKDNAGAVNAGVDDGGADDSCFAFNDQDGPTAKCTVDNKCTKLTSSSTNCQPSDPNAADSVWTTCSQYGGSKDKCEEAKCVFEKTTTSVCVDAGSCESGVTKEKCEAIKNDKDEAKCAFSPGTDATADLPAIPAICADRGSGVDGHSDGGGGSIAGQNGTCSFDVGRDTSEGNAGGSGSGFGTQSTCQKINATSAAGRTDCGIQRSDDGLQLCEIVNRTVTPGACGFTGKSAGTTTQSPDSAGGYYGGEYAQDECVQLQTVDDCKAESTCTVSTAMCECANVDELPTRQSSDYGGYGNYGGNPEPAVPTSAYACAAAPAAAKCVMEETGMCSPMNGTGWTDEEMQERCYRHGKKANCPLDRKCEWMPTVRCMSKKAHCKAIGDAKECGASAAAALECMWEKEVLSYTCERRTIGDDERCAKYSDHHGCSGEPGCAFQKDVNNFYGDVEGEAGFSGDGASIFTDCFAIDTAQVCEKATGQDTHAPCQTDTTAKEPLSATKCAAVESQMCGTTEGCKVAETKKCAWARNVLSECVGKAGSSAEETASCEALPVGGGICAGDTKCDVKETEDADCIPFDACAVLVSKGQESCEAKKGCSFEAGASDDEGSCNVKDNRVAGGTGGVEVTGDGEGESKDLNITAPELGSGAGGQQCLGKISKDSCNGDESCEWASGLSAGFGGEQKSDRCFFDIGKLMDTVALPGDGNAGAGGADLGGNDMLSEYGACYSQSNKTGCETGTTERCVPAGADSPNLSKCLANEDKSSCVAAKCSWEAAKLCKWYEPKQEEICTPADEEDFDSKCWGYEDINDCKADSGCKVIAQAYQAICSPNMAEDEFDKGSGSGGAQEANENGSGKDPEGPDLGGLGGVSTSNCALMPEQCCMNAFGEDDCNKLKDDAGSQLCKYTKSEANAYCGGILCNATLTKGLNQAECGKVTGCGWVEQAIQQAQCTYFNKCHGLGAQKCLAFKGKGCEYVGGDEDGAGFSANSQGYCDAKAGEEGESPCFAIETKDDCDANAVCTFNNGTSSDGGDDKATYSQGYCSAPINEKLDEESIASCDESVGDRAYNSTSCNAATGCKWFTADKAIGGDGEDIGSKDTTSVTNCLAVPYSGGITQEDGPEDPGSGFGDFCGGSNPQCQCHDTVDECRNPKDAEGLPKCGWYTFDDVAGAEPQCMKYNKCDQPTELKCTEMGCSYVKEFDPFSGGIVGQCKTPPSKFVQEAGSNYTCIAFQESSAGGNYGSGYDFNYGTDAPTTTTTQEPTTTVAPTKATDPPTTTTTITTTTITTKEDELHNKDGTVLDKEDMSLTTVPGATKPKVSFFDATNLAIDLEFKDHRYDTLGNTAEDDLNVKVEAVILKRMEDLGIARYHYKSATAFAEGKLNRDLPNVGGLTVRLAFRTGALTTDEIIKLNRNLKSAPTGPFKLFGRVERYFQSDAVLVKKADHPLWWPAEAVKETSTPAPEITGAQGQELDESQQIEAERVESERIAAQKAVNSEKAGKKLTVEQERKVIEKGKTVAGYKYDLAACERTADSCTDARKAELQIALDKASAEADDIVAESNLDVTARPQDKATDEEDYTPVIVAIVIVVIVAGLIAAVIVFVFKHRAYDEVYGSVARQGIYGGGVYGNPVYAGGAQGMPPQGFMSTTAAADYKPPTAGAAPKKAGLVRQESMC